jgi:hypothetical protein
MFAYVIIILIIYSITQYLHLLNNINENINSFYEIRSILETREFQKNLQLSVLLLQP